LYADDTILLAESRLDLQNDLHAISDYCKIRDLPVNEDKTKNLIFSSHKFNKNNFFFSYNGRELEIVEDFS